MSKTNIGFDLEVGCEGALEVTDIENVVGHHVTLGELAQNYKDDSQTITGGVTGWGGKLDIRPKFQRAYVVEDNPKWKTDLVRSVLNNRPIGVMYFGKNDDGTFINIDGQQRLMTLLSFINNGDALPQNVNGNPVDVVFSQLPSDWQERIRNYCPCIKVCDGDEDAQLMWFKTINKPICVLTTQELRNASYRGSFVEAIKCIFAKTSSKCAPTMMNGRYIDESNPTPYFYKKWFKGIDPVRQDLVECVLDWASYRDYPTFDKDSRIESYMLRHRNDSNANDSENYYKEVIDWVLDIFFHNNSFPTNPREWQNIQNQDWNVMYEKYKEITKNYTEKQKEYITERCKHYIGLGTAFYANSRGIYEWVILGENMKDTRLLHIRPFRDEDKTKMYKYQGGIDPIDGNHYNIEDLHAHHIVSFKSGGISIIDNMVLLSEESHRNLHANCTHSPEQLKQLRNNLLKSNGVSII